MSKAELVFPVQKPLVLGEGCVYRPEDKTLHYVDCLYEPPQMHILSLDDNGNALYKSTVSKPSDDSPKNTSQPGLKILDLTDSVSVAQFRENTPGSYVCLSYQGFAFLDEETGKIDMQKEVIPTEDRNIRRMNDGAVDPYGKFWGGEIDHYALGLGAGKTPEGYKPIGRLWRFDPDGTVHEMDDGLVCSNGLAWTMDKSLMFLNDSAGQKIWRYSFHADSSISGKTLIKDYAGTAFEPDGLCIDTDDNLYVALYASCCVQKLDKDGKVLEEFPVPAHAVTCPTWGGPKNNTLYVTSGYYKEGDASNEGGQVYKLEIPGVTGQDKYRFKG